MNYLQDPSSLFGQFSEGDSIVVHSAFSAPMQLVEMLAAHAEILRGVEVYTLMPMVRPAYAEQGPASSLRLNSFFPGVGLRAAFNEGRVNALCYPLSEIPSLFTENKLQANLLLLQVSPPDENGDVSLGVSVDYMQAVIAQKPTIVAEVSDLVPRTCGDTKLPASEIDWFIDAEAGPLTIERSDADEVDQRIATNVASLIEDGAVLQVGIGSLPDQVLAELSHLRHLGVHSGIITDAIQPLIESGVVDNSRKDEFAGVSISTMAGGSQSFYQFLHRNPAVELHPCSLTHDINRLASITGLTAVNSVLQVDLAGSANAEAVNGKIVAMPGGLPDFAAGASRARQGKSIIALRSSFKRGSVSNIVTDFGSETPKTLSAEAIDYIVTEYGVAEVSSIDPKQRAKALINIAHPDFRESLERSLANIR